MRHIISVLLENESGALARLVGLFAQRGYNIDSLNVAPTDDPTLSRLTLVTHGNDQVIEQISKQLHKLIEVVKVSDISEAAHIERELMLVKVKANTTTRTEIIQIAEVFRASIVDVCANSLTIEVTGRRDKVQAIIEMLSTYGIEEIARTGTVALLRDSVQK